jgi:hypothetical protein
LLGRYLQERCVRKLKERGYQDAIYWIALCSPRCGSYSFYFRDIFKRQTKPHALTWFVWAILNSLIFIEQYTHDAGAGAWVTGTAALANIIIFFLSFKYGERSITKLDWLCLGIAIPVIGLWLLQTNDALTIILACAIFIIGFIPTLRKSYQKPGDETAITFGLNGTKFLIALFALSSFTMTTAFYPLVLAIVNILFVIYLLSRRNTLKYKVNKLRRT